MTRLGAALLLALAGCSTVPVIEREPWVDVGRMLHLSTELGLAHGCPVAETTILTSRHVVEPLIWGQRLHLGARWSADDVEGYAWIVKTDMTSDLVMLTTSKPVRRVFPIAEEPPAVGDEILLRGYDWEKAGFPPRYVVATVTAVRAGRVIYADSAGRGSSGGCVLSRNLETLAIHGQTIHGSGMGVATWGQWNPLAQAEE